MGRDMTEQQAVEILVLLRQIAAELSVIKAQGEAMAQMMRCLNSDAMPLVVSK